MSNILKGLTITENSNKMDPKYDYKFWDELTPDEKMNSANLGQGVTVFNDKTKKYSTKFPVEKTQVVPLNLNDDDFYEIDLDNNTIIKQRGPQSYNLPFGERFLKLDNGNIVMRGMTMKMKGLDKILTYKTTEDIDLEEQELDEDLRKWFKEKWVRFGPDGKIRGDCARGDDSEGKPKCLPQSKAQSLGKKGRASAAARKRREDPNPERSGKAINVATKKKSNEGVAEGSLNELSKDTLKSYAKKAVPDMQASQNKSKAEYSKAALAKDDETANKHYDAAKQAKDRTEKRMAGVAGAIKRFNKEGVAEGSNAPYWRVEQSEATGRYYVVTGYTDKSRKVWKNKLGAADFNKKENAEAKANELNQGVVEGDDPWGPQGNFAGDKPVNVGDVTMKIIQVGDTVKYLGQRAKVVGMSKDRKYSRIAIESGFGGTTKDVLTADLKQLGQGVSEVSDSTKQNYKARAQAQVKELEPYAKKGEYKDIAQRAIDRRQKGLAKVKDVTEEQLDELKCWPGYTRVQGVPAGAPGSCKKKTNEEQHSEKCPHCGGELVSEELINEKKDACYYKVKSRYKVWPSAYASGALVKCRKKGADSWGNKSEGVAEGLNEMDKTQTPPGRDGDIDWTKKQIHLGPEHTMKAKDVAKHALKILNKTMKKSHADTPKKKGVAEEQLDEKWSQKYKDSINCSNPKGFSQKAHCAGKNKNESAILTGLKLHESK